jgi:hypothetical protein
MSIAAELRMGRTRWAILVQAHAKVKVPGMRLGCVVCATAHFTFRCTIPKAKRCDGASSAAISHSCSLAAGSRGVGTSTVELDVRIWVKVTSPYLRRTQSPWRSRSYRAWMVEVM